MSKPKIHFVDWQLSIPAKGVRFFCDAANPSVPLPEPPDKTKTGFWIFRSEMGLCGVAATGLSVKVAGRPARPLACLTDGDEIDFSGEKGRFQDIFRLRLTRRAATCPNCRSHHVAGAIVVRCPWCESSYCEDCWDEIAGNAQMCGNQCGFHIRRPYWRAIHDDI